MDEIKETLKLLNPWWTEGTVNGDLAKPYKRKMFGSLLELLDYRQTIIVSGLRRVGKTTLLYQLIGARIGKNDPRETVYFNFDKKVTEITTVLESYEALTGMEWKKKKIFVFLDEIAKLEDWANKIKLLYDAFPNLKFVVSSSSSSSLENDAISSLAGRHFLVNVKPLSFVEYLELGGNARLAENAELWKTELKMEFERYLLRSFPETIGWEDEYRIKDYLRTTVIDKIIREDLPEKFRNINRDLLFTLLGIFYGEPGIYLDYDGLSKTLRISKRTLIKHIFYLEFSYLIRRIKNFRVSALAASRKMQRAYAGWWTLAYCHTDNKDRIMENVVASSSDAKYYWRKNDKEVDFLLLTDDDEGKKNIVPVEVKNKKDIAKDDIKNLKYFLGKYDNAKEGIVIYSGDDETEIGLDKTSGKKIRLVPLWRWLLLSQTA